MKKSMKIPSILHWIIGIIIMALGSVLPASAPLTDMGVRVLMIFIGMIYLWCTVNPIGGSLLALFAISMTGYAPLTEVLSAAISDSTWVLMFFSIILFISGIESGMPQYISHGIFKATQNIVTGRPMMLVFILMISAFVISALTDVIPATLMFWAICYTIIDELNLEKRDYYSILLIMASFLGAMLGNAMLPFKGATIIILSAFEAASGVNLAYGTYFFIYLITGLAIMVLFCLGCKFFFHIDTSKVKNINGHILAQEKLEPMSISVKAHLIAIFAFIILVLISSILPRNSVIGTFLNNLDTQGISVVLLIFLFMIKDSDGKVIVHINKVASKIPWPALFMVMSTVYMAGAMKNAEICGVIPWLKTILSPILGGHSEFIFMAIIVGLAMILTCFFHNGALGNMMMPILFAVADASGYHSIAIAAVMTMAINVAFLAPSASNWAPLLHANKECIATKDIWTIGLFFEVLAFLIYIVIGYPLATLLF